MQNSKFNSGNTHTFEYKFINVLHAGALERLNKYGLEGWEVIYVGEGKFEFHFLLKRQRQ